ncbi:GNAT family N-acetyltransferase [Paenibacillus septentrionalis]|uniref:GNAT family N-acetyltransferase n=1 Tax=Paenibacillus septentrionalis TaxID=429342 RepID=A0ABW1V278_9BACL
MIRFTAAEEKYLKNVRDIYNDYVANTTVSFDVEPASIDKMRELTMHSDPRFCSYVILDDDRVIGYMMLSPFIKKHSCARTAEITIYLDGEFKAKGIGSQALEYLERKATEHGFHTLIAVVCTENERSISLFKRHHYQLKGILEQVAYKFDRYLDVAYMAKIL